MRTWSLHNEEDCLLKIEGITYPCDLIVRQDIRRTGTPDHVVMKGNFAWMKEWHDLTTNGWLEFKLDLTSNYHPVFHVKKMY